MRNYAEEFAYWYLRLNGFFIITDFVLHSKHGDMDVLAVRPPYATEYVKGKRLEEDEKLVELVKQSKGDLRKQFTAFIAEVKGGRTKISSKGIAEKFDLESLKYILRRIGLFDYEYADAFAEDLLNSKWLTIDGTSIHKVLFAYESVFEPSETDCFSFVSIEQTVKFIEQRMGLNFKNRDWHLFDSNLIQQMIHQAAGR